MNPFFPEIRFEEQYVVKKKLFGRIDDRLNCVIQDDLDAYIAEPKESREPINWDMFSYFRIPITVGVGSKGPTVETFDYTLEIQRIGIDGPDDMALQIIDVEPKKEVITHPGEGIRHDKTKETTKGGSLSGKAGLSIDPVANIEGSAGLGGRETNKVTESYGYEKQVISRVSIASASHVNWRFKKYSSIGVEGHYELAVYFRLRRPLAEITEGTGMYVAYPSIYVNNERLTESWLEFKRMHSPLEPMKIYFHTSNNE